MLSSTVIQGEFEHVGKTLLDVSLLICVCVQSRSMFKVTP